MTKLTSLLDALESINKNGEECWSAEVPDNWKQGRTAFGGFSTALAHHCARLSLPDAPPLRSAQLAFVGPLYGTVEVSCELLRRGRNTAFVQTRISSEKGTGFTGCLVFMNPRESSVVSCEINPPFVPPPPADDETRQGPKEYFTSNLDYPEKRLKPGSERPVLRGWHRLREREGLDPITELLCIGDALPPSAMGLMETPGMVSSMNWQVNILQEKPQTDDGWWYLRSETHHAANGASSQYMTVWNRRMQPVMTGMQSVALFV